MNSPLSLRLGLVVACVSPLCPLAAQEIAVDPSGTVSSNYAAEWNSAGNAESWTGVNATLSVSGGVLSGAATSDDAAVQLTNLAGGPDLDLGWNDFMDIRIQVPAAYTGPIRFSFGTTYRNGFDDSREFEIAAASIPNDGAFHTYRIALGLEPLWRSNLRDLRIHPVGGAGTSGMSFAIDHIRIGDEPNAPVYQRITSTETPAAGGTTPAGAAHGPGQTVKSMESKHFVFLWNDAAEADGFWTPDMPHGTLRNLEEAWQVFVHVMGYIEPCYSGQDKSGQLGTPRGKVALHTWYDGFWAGGYTDDAGRSRVRMNMAPGGLRVDPPGWVVPHELMHCFQFHNNEDSVNGTKMPGYWYEGHANYARERWLIHYEALYPDTSSVGAEALRGAHQLIADARYQYLSWLPLLYLDTNPDNLPDLGDSTVRRIWQETLANTNPLMTLDVIAPTTGRKDIFGYYARRGATLSYPAQPHIAASASWDPQVPRYQFTDLVQRSDDPSWWRVPSEMAPQQGGYTIHELVVPNPGTGGRTVTVNFRGLPNAARGADWRAAFVIVADDGSERYSPLWNSGNQSVTLAANENTLYLTVAATPDNFAYVEADEIIYPYRSHPGKTRFPYEMQVTGATPHERISGSTDGLVQHANGGGWKSPTANVASTAYLAPGARVLGSAVVTGNARIEDYAVVQDNAQVRDDAIVSGHGWLMNNAVVEDDARVRDWAVVRENAVISGNGRAFEHADVKGGAIVSDTSVVKGTAVDLDGTLSSNAILDGPYWAWRDIDGGFASGHAPFVGMPDEWITPLPDGIYAAYNFATAHDSRILDRYGVTHGFTVGSPAWLASDGTHSGVLSFNGSSQHVNLERSVADSRHFTFAAWIKPAGGASNQAVVWLGASPTQRLAFTPDEGSGQAKFSIVNGGAEQSLTAPALTTGTWTHVAVTLSGDNGVLYINGAPVGSAAIGIAADELLAPNTAGGLQHNYLARSEGSEMAKFNGSLDDVGFYSSVLTPAQVVEISAAPPAIIGSAGSFAGLGNTKEKAFDGDLGTYFDAVNGSGDWVGRDLGVAKQITQVKYCPRTNWAARMKGGKFQASNTADFSSGVVDLFTIPSGIFVPSPAQGVLTIQSITDTGTYRYVRYLGPNNSYCNVAELEFVTAPASPAAPGVPAGLTAVAGEEQVSLSWSVVGGEAGYNLKRSTSSSGPYTTIASPTLPEFTDTTATDGTRGYPKTSLMRRRAHVRFTKP